MPRKSNPRLREDLLRAAISLLDGRGEADFSMRDLCAEVDYSVTAAYRVFRSRSHLLQAMQLQLFAQLGQALLAPSLAPVPRQLVDLGGRFVRWAIDHPARYRFMFHSTEPEVLLDPADQALARAPLAYLESLLAQGHANGELHVADAAASAVMLFATLHGFLSLHLCGRLDAATVPDPAAFYDQWASAWIAALNPSTSSSNAP